MAQRLPCENILAPGIYTSRRYSYNTENLVEGVISLQRQSMLKYFINLATQLPPSPNP